MAAIAARSTAFVARAAAARRSTVAPKRVVARASLTQPLPGAGEDRPLWLPGSKAPAHLDGSLAGDYGFDPLGLGADPEDLKFFVEAEIQHARWAMLGMLGILGPELMEKQGLIDVPAWYEAGNYGEYFTDGLTLFCIQLSLMGWAEGRRWADLVSPGSVSEDPVFGGYKVGTGAYPGGAWFDPLGLASDEKTFNELKLKEIKNGRLAMVALVGVAAQASATKELPLDNWLNHIADPAGTTLFVTLYK